MQNPQLAAAAAGHPAIPYCGHLAHPHYYSSQAMIPQSTALIPEYVTPRAERNRHHAPYIKRCASYFKRRVLPRVPRPH